MQISNQRIRLAIDTAQMGSINDVLTGQSPQFWNGVDLQFELGLFRGSALVDISNLDSITAGSQGIRSAHRAAAYVCHHCQRQHEPGVDAG